MSKNEYDRIKIITLGNTDVGKSCFILRFTENFFKENFLSTQGIDLKSKYITIDEKLYRVDFYDTAGQEKYKSIAYNVIKNADGILLIYDVTQIKTFESISEWIDNIEMHKQPDVQIILIGNKCDLKESRNITYDEGKELAEKYKCDFFETSNKEGTNVEEAGNALVKKIIEVREKRKKEKSDNHVIKNLKTKQSNKKSCC